MGLLNQNPLEQFRPKTIKFSDVYKHRTNYGAISDSDRKKINASLKHAGYSDKQISQMVRQNAALPTKKIERAVNSLKTSGIKGFDYNSRTIVNNYVRHEMIKRKNINRVMHERRKEAWAEDLSGGKGLKGGSTGSMKASQRPKLNF